MAYGPHTFHGDDRFSVSRELGRGGMGVVYEAYDRVRGEKIALKTLQWADPSAIYRFKREFRALADVAHSNLVNLYELVAHDDIWFFTMELVIGEDFLRYVRPGWVTGDHEASLTEVDLTSSTPEVLAAREKPTGDLDSDRLRAALLQLAEGVAAIHEAGKVHRDIKPRNVLVTKTGRVVILDFGISEDMSRSHALVTQGDGISGTVEYMAPELCAGEECLPCSDWYSVGVLLYEALTGEVPFTGSFLRVLTQKQAQDPPRPEEVASDLPPDLADLCVSLMARSPADRPSGAEVLRRLGISEPAVVIDPHLRAGGNGRLIGRSNELAELERAFEVAADGQACSLCVSGPSGIGKSTLVQYFTDRLMKEQKAVVLAGRCYVRENVPYKALDGVIDMLSRLLRSMPQDTVEARLPKGTAALARIFPVLRRVPAVDRCVFEAVESTWDQREIRRRAFDALREALRVISTQQPIVIHIDDLQWADRDSADILDEMLEDTGQLRVLFIFSFRAEEASEVPLLRQLLQRSSTHTQRSLELLPFNADDVRELISARLGSHGPEAAVAIDTVVKESAGNPFLLDQILRFVLEGGGDTAATSFSLGRMLNTRLAQMPAGARQLVDVLAIAGQPVDADIAYHAAGLVGDERPLVRSLRIAHLLRTSADGDRIDLYHDRIRVNFLQQIEPEAAKGIHLSLATGMEEKGVDEPESLYSHFLGAGDMGRAAGYAAQAARAARETLAFEREAFFYRRALDLAHESDPNTLAWHIGLGDALGNAGRSAEAARAYVDATSFADEFSALELERRAGQQLLIGGRIDEGLEKIGEVLQKVGLSLAPTPKRALLSLIKRRIQLRVRGMRYTERPEEEIPADELTRIDTCWAVAEGMALVDNIQGAAFQTLHLILALEAGEPTRIARALAMEAGFVSSSGSEAGAARLLEQAEEHARRLDSPTTVGLCRMISAIGAFYTGRCQEGERLVKIAEELLAAQPTYATWQLNIARVHHIPLLLELGEVAELCRLTRHWVEDAKDRGNLFTAAMFSTGWGCLVWLCPDNVEGAREAIREAPRHHRARSYFLPDYYRMMSEIATDLYDGDGASAYRRITGVWPVLKSSQLLRIRVVRLRQLLLRAWSALAAANERRKGNGNREHLLRVATKDAKELAKEQHYSPKANLARAHLIQAAVAAQRGDDKGAVDHLNIAIDGFEVTGSMLMHSVARRRLGELVGGDRGKALIAESDAWMAGQGIVSPSKITRVFAAGFPGGKDG